LPARAGAPGEALVAADGFNVMLSYFHEGFEDFVQLVVPILQERGLFRTEYEGTTLPDHLGLQRPKNNLFKHKAKFSGNICFAPLASAADARLRH
jgi:hypothetical protein